MRVALFNTNFWIVTINKRIWNSQCKGKQLSWQCSWCERVTRNKLNKAKSERHCAIEGDLSKQHIWTQERIIMKAFVSMRFWSWTWKLCKELRMKPQDMFRQKVNFSRYVLVKALRVLADFSGLLSYFLSFSAHQSIKSWD